jgi:hypothetical protein
MNPADQRVAELVDKWLKSLELHLKYATLSDEAYWQVQPWVRHQRPARWILDLARARAVELKRQLDARAAANDAGFGEALELMAFLANLVGAQNIERFIPLAEPERENPDVLSETQPRLPALSLARTQDNPALDATREMPGPDATREMPAPVMPSPIPPAAKAAPARSEPPPAPAPPPPRAAAPPPAALRAAARREPAPAKPGKGPAAGSAEAQIVADAVRLLKWGREWHELADSIARIADRPGAAEIRRVLKTFRADIERISRG